MANNRLFIYDPETNEAFMLAKSIGNGWFPELTDAWFNRLASWLEFRDQLASYGNATETSRLQLLTENELPSSCKESG